MFRFDPFSPEIDANPFPAYKTLRDEYPCFWSEEANMWVLSRYQDIVMALNDWETFSSAKGNLMSEMPGRAGATLGTSDPPRHDRMRALIQKAVMKRALDHIIEPAHAAARARLEAVKDKQPFDFVEDFSANYTVDLIAYLFNLPAENLDTVREKAVLMVQSDPVTRTKSPEHLAAFEWMRDYADTLVEIRKREPGEDLLSQFILAEIDGEKLEDREIQLTVTTLIMAGIESLSGFMSMLMKNLTDFTDVRDALVADPSKIPDAIEESLRFNTSAQRFKRCVQKEITLHGQTLKPGDFVCLAYGSGNRDERQFANPDVYDLERKPKGHLGFGGGVHACLGIAIARLACKVAVEEILAMYPTIHSVEQEIQWMPSSTFRSPLHLWLKA
ncbi:putative cytochrome P450 hydroxylase [Marinobacterium lacunae]|uniref:Putative cytochrome P450 hydroxylase n=1 Tax=Marinobacterium lacunae TaxID=1232683 RepID=A0A081FUU7_9GAMM|nr:cytochrome P450 [Marinobacterium lacunae]KEA62302.1 putative cytochrome P450 hydroxylase [Marinobacterium lacunae]